MDDKLELFEELLLGDEGLLISLRLARGLSNEKVDKVCEVLDKLASDWENQDSIPKKAVDLFVDFYPAMESTCGLYEEDELIEIMNAVDKIMDRIRDCIVVK